MKTLIQDYQETYRAVKQRSYELKQQYHGNKELKTMERERLKARIDLLEEEGFELVQIIHELKQHRRIGGN